jgi:hypothetical protein
MWPESARELYLPSDRRLSTNLVPNFADRLCDLVSVTEAVKLLAICEPIVYKIWEPLRLTAIRASNICYGDSSTF